MGAYLDCWLVVVDVAVVEVSKSSRCKIGIVDIYRAKDLGAGPRCAAGVRSEGKTASKIMIISSRHCNNCVL